MKEQQIEKVFLHIIADGRYSPPKSALESVRSLEEKIASLNIGTIGSVLGRYYAMDRDRRWERTEKAYNCLTKGSGSIATSISAVIEQSYKQ